MAEQYGTEAERPSEEWRAWRESDRWQQWNAAMAPVVTARRRTMRLLGDKQAVRILFDEIAPRFVDRPGGYTRILRLAKPRLGDAGTRAILEFVGVRDRVSRKSAAPKFDSEEEQSSEAPLEDVSESEPQADDAQTPEAQEPEARSEDQPSDASQDDPQKES